MSFTMYSPQEMGMARGGNGGRIKVPGDGKVDDGITGMDEPDCPTYDCYPESGPFDTEGKPSTQELDFDYVLDDALGPILGGSGGSGGGGSSESDTASENHAGDFWDFNFLDECIVPYDCGDEENDEGNNDEGSGLPDEENSEEGNNG